jgi:hypothetical protein
MPPGARSAWRAILAIAVSIPLAAASEGEIAASPGAAASPVVDYAPQGWSAADRQTFYHTSQGSRIMPYDWFKALRRTDIDESFGGDQLQRYGYIRDDQPGNVEGLPIGFVIDPRSEPRQVGMTCAACHTSQIEYQKDGVAHALRIDGGRANSDFQQFLTDLVAATRATLTSPSCFDAFAQRVLGPGATAAATAGLKADLAGWVHQFGDFMDASLPASSWGPGRLDAFGMIFNRVAGLDLGEPDNMRKADAPVRYPFLWNASRQDHTQWFGGVPNGLYIQGLARNTGEVFGVFGEFRPKVLSPANWLTPTLLDDRANSADFAGMQTLEEKIVALKPPPWPRDVFPINDDLAKTGARLFEDNCGRCHDEKASSQVPNAWQTPVRTVWTDPKVAVNAARMSNPGPYAGALLPPPSVFQRFQNPARTTDILASSVIGSLLYEVAVLPVNPQSGVWRALRKDSTGMLPTGIQGAALSSNLSAVAQARGNINSRLGDLYGKPRQPVAGAKYEARVLHGIWATAPYLHNGSVANLWELLLPASQRKTVFMVGSRVFDPTNVGFATDQSPFVDGKFTADSSNANGNGNGGHEFGTGLSPDKRRAIIEYMKTL